MFWTTVFFKTLLIERWSYSTYQTCCDTSQTWNFQFLPTQSMVTTFTFVNHLLELGVTNVNCPRTVGKLSNTISRTNYWFIASLVPKPLWCSLRLPLQVAQMPCPSTIGCWCHHCPTSNMIHPHWTLRQTPCAHIRQKKHNSVTKIWLRKTLSMLDLTINPEQRAYNKRCRRQAQNMAISVQTQTVTGASSRAAAGHYLCIRLVW